MTVVIEIGEPGRSDVVLEELEGAARQLGLPVELTALMMMGMGLAAAQADGMIVRTTPDGEGFRRAGVNEGEALLMHELLDHMVGARRQ